MSTYTDPIDKIRFGRAAHDKFTSAVRGGLTQRFCGPQSTWSDEFTRHVGHIARDSDQFINRPLPEIAGEFCERAGIRPAGRPDSVVKALLLRSADPALHTTGDFGSLLLDAQAKTLRKAYEEAPTTYQIWTRQGESAQSFKELHRVVFGDFNLPEQVPENTEYPEANTEDARESYRVTKHGQIFSVSLEAIVNDDVASMRRVPQQQGHAMRRKINQDCYRLLIDNPTLRDGVTLFHATSHGENLDATALAAGAPLNVGYSVMALQTGTDATNVLGLSPRFLIVPTALSATALQITRDQFEPVNQSDIALYGPRGPRTLRVVPDGQIDALGTATNWWLAADPGDIDTVEVTFLAGEETPVLEQHSGFANDTVQYKIRQSYGVKAIDYRGLYQGNS